MTRVRIPATIDCYPMGGRFNHRAGRDCPCSPRAGVVMSTGQTAWMHRTPPAERDGWGRFPTLDPATGRREIA